MIDLNAEVLAVARRPMSVAQIRAAVVRRHPEVATTLRDLDVEVVVTWARQRGAVRPVYEPDVPLPRRRYVGVGRG